MLDGVTETLTAHSTILYEFSSKFQWPKRIASITLAEFQISKQEISKKSADYWIKRDFKYYINFSRLTWEIHIHAIGDKAITEALDALEFARNANGSRDSRHHIAHIQIPNPKDLPRYINKVS